MSPRLSNIQNEIDPQHLQHPVLQFLRTYWDGKRQGRLMPRRSDINPAELKEHLGWVILADVLPGFTDFRFRTIGTRVAQTILADATGKTVTEGFALYGKAAVQGALAVLRKSARDRVPLRAFGDAGWVGHSFLDFDALFLPLSDDGMTTNMILAVLVFDVPKLPQTSVNDGAGG